MKSSPRQWVFLFEPQFVSDVIIGNKRRTIRAERKDRKRPAVGDRVSLRRWMGKPYRSKQSVLRESTVTAVTKIYISEFLDLQIGKVWIDQERDAELLEKFAKDDGFASRSDMMSFFERVHGTPFEGFMTEWE